MSYYFWLGRDSYMAEGQLRVKEMKRRAKSEARAIEAEGFITVHPKLKS